MFWFCPEGWRLCASLCIYIIFCLLAYINVWKKRRISFSSRRRTDFIRSISTFCKAICDTEQLKLFIVIAFCRFVYVFFSFSFICNSFGWVLWFLLVDCYLSGCRISSESTNTHHKAMDIMILAFFTNFFFSHTHYYHKCQILDHTSQLTQKKTYYTQFQFANNKIKRSQTKYETTTTLTTTKKLDPKKRKTNKYI